MIGFSHSHDSELIMKLVIAVGLLIAMVLMTAESAESAESAEDPNVPGSSDTRYASSSSSSYRINTVFSSGSSDRR